MSFVIWFGCGICMCVVCGYAWHHTPCCISVCTVLHVCAFCTLNEAKTVVIFSRAYYIYWLTWSVTRKNVSVRMISATVTELFRVLRPGYLDILIHLCLRISSVLDCSIWPLSLTCFFFVFICTDKEWERSRTSWLTSKRNWSWMETSGQIFSQLVRYI